MGHGHVHASVRSFADLGALPGIMTTDANADKLVAFIRSYQAAHNGATPTYDAMANELGVPEEAVRILLSRLEQRGRIFFVSRRPPHIMLDSKPGEEGPTGEARAGAAKRFLDAEGMRHKLGRYIAQHEREFGCGPSLQMMMQETGINNAAYVRRMVEILGERGVVDCPPGRPPSLTAQGREFYGLKQPALEKEKIIVVREPTENERNGETRERAKRFPVEVRAQQLCEALAEAKREKGSLNYCPFFAELAPRIGYRAVDGSGAISRAAQKAVELGWIASYGHNKKHALQFTDEGLRKFMPEFAPQEQPRRDVPPLDGFMPRVPQVYGFGSDVGLGFSAAAREAEVPPIGEGTARMCAVAKIPTADLVLELIDRGYIVRKA